MHSKSTYYFIYLCFQGKKKAKEQQALEKFMERIHDVMKPEYDDIYLMKWLKGKIYTSENGSKVRYIPQEMAQR